MDASSLMDSVAPFIQINQHLHQLGFAVCRKSLPWTNERGFLLLERISATQHLCPPIGGPGGPRRSSIPWPPTSLVALHQHPQASSRQACGRIIRGKCWKMSNYFWNGAHGFGGRQGGNSGLSGGALLPEAHWVPSSLLLQRLSCRQSDVVAGASWPPAGCGLLDFQDAYQGPVTYDLVSLLEDARRDVAEGLQTKMTTRYLAQFP